MTDPSSLLDTINVTIHPAGGGGLSRMHKVEHGHNLLLPLGRPDGEHRALEMLDDLDSRLHQAFPRLRVLDPPAGLVHVDLPDRP